MIWEDKKWTDWKDIILKLQSKTIRDIYRDIDLILPL